MKFPRRKGSSKYAGREAQGGKRGRLTLSWKNEIPFVFVGRCKGHCAEEKKEKSSPEKREVQSQKKMGVRLFSIRRRVRKEFPSPFLRER